MNYYVSNTFKRENLVFIILVFYNLTRGNYSDDFQEVLYAGVLWAIIISFLGNGKKENEQTASIASFGYFILIPENSSQFCELNYIIVIL